MLDEGRLLDHEQRISGPVERMLYLKRLPMVGTLGGAELALLAEQMGERFFRKDTVMLREGEPPGALYFPVEGMVHITRHNRVLGHAGPGRAVAPFHLLARDEQGVGAVAETDTLVLELSTERLREIFEDNFAILRHVIREVSRQIVDHVVKVPAAATFLGEQGEEAPTPTRELDLVERIFFLRRAPVFTRASISALAQLSRGLTEVRLPAGTRLWREGEAATWASLLVSGRVRCTSSRGHAFNPGAGVPLGALDAVADVPRWYDAVTETPVVALQGNMQTLFDVFEDNFDMAMDYLAVMARWLLVILERSLASKDRLERLYGCGPEAEASSDPVGAAPAPAAAGPAA